MVEFQKFRELIQKPIKPSELYETDFSSPYYKRWVNAFKNQSTLGKKDIGSLIRNILRFESEKQGGNVLLKVPKDNMWPNTEEWGEFGVEVVDDQNNGIVVQAKRWVPVWLPLSQVYPPDTPLFALEKRNEFSSVTGDPFLEVLNLGAYRSNSQRDAVRSIFSAPPGSTLVVNLPTGTGKSLCAHLPGVIYGKNFGLTIVVVPTVALAIDQERVLSNFVSHPTGYYGGHEREEVKKGIRERIINGTQQIVFASPESLLQSLQLPLQLAAERGFLKMFVIDEAHIVGLWGDEFRPAFQQIAGLRNFLMSACEEPFVTLLLSATISELCLDTIETLFAKPGPFEIFASVKLRPEPSYWMRKCETEEEKYTYLVEAIAHLPRPLIIYTTQVQDAIDLADTLQFQGYSRTAVVTGETSSSKRNEIIQQWQSREKDIIVATSAFGLGVDQAEVRAVIHACLPENIDRFYQEIGRGGRDGKASLSLLLYTDADIRMAEKMNRTILIGVDRGKQRWEQMFHHKKVIKGINDQFFVPIKISPGYSEAEIDMNSQQNEAWNIRTLNLMQRAGLIQMLWEERKKEEEAIGDDYRLVRILDENHLEEWKWKEAFEPVRQSNKRSEKNSLSLMKMFLSSDCCVSDVFSSIYRIHKREHPYRKELSVTMACGGCPYCRQQKLKAFENPLVSKPVQWDKICGVEEERLLSFLGMSDKRLVVFYPSKVEKFQELSRREQHHWRMLIRFYLDNGVHHIIGNRDFLAMLKQDELLFNDKIVFLTYFDKLERRMQWPSVPTLVFHPSSHQFNQLIAKRLKEDRSSMLPEVYFIPDAISDPNKPERLYKDVIPLRHYTIDEFKLEVGLI